MKKMNEMTIEELKEITGIITDEEFDELLENENVIESECLGFSSYHTTATWYDISLTDGTTIDIYVE